MDVKSVLLGKCDRKCLLNQTSNPSDRKMVGFFWLTWEGSSAASTNNKKQKSLPVCYGNATHQYLRACKHQCWRFQSPILLGSHVDGYWSHWEHLQGQGQKSSCRVEASLPTIAHPAWPGAASMIHLEPDRGHLGPSTPTQDFKISPHDTALVACARLTCHVESHIIRLGIKPTCFLLLCKNRAFHYAFWISRKFSHTLAGQLKCFISKEFDIFLIGSLRS